MTTVLVTGGSGFIGTNLCDYLVGADHKVIVVDKAAVGRSRYLPQEVEFIAGDILDPEPLGDAFSRADVVVHLAADTRVIDSIENPRYNLEVNVLGTYNVLSLAREYGVSRVVNASTGGAILGDVAPPVHERMVPNPSSPYGASKLAAEGYCSAFAQSYGVSSISLRFSNVYGPFSCHKGSVVAKFFRQIKAGEGLTVYGDGSQKRDYVYTKDLVRGIGAAIESDATGPVQLASGTPTTLDELIVLIKEVTGADDLDVAYEDFRAGEVRDTYCDISRAREALGYSPRVSLRDGLGETWAWFKEHC